MDPQRYAIVFAALLVPAGRWADAFGRKRAFLLGLGIFVAASAACALAPSVGVLIGARVVQAVGGALMLPTSLGLMLPEFEPERAPRRDRRVGGDRRHRRGRRARRSAACWCRPTGGWVFLVNVPVGLLGLVFGLRTLVERREAGRAPPGRRSARSALIVAIGSLVVAIVKGQEWGWGSPAIARAVRAHARCCCRRSGGAPNASPRRSSSRRCCACAASGWRSAASVLFFAASARCCWRACCSSPASGTRSVLTAGLMLFPGPAMATAFSVPSARLGARVGYRIPGVIGALMFARGHRSGASPQTGDTPAYVSRVPAGHAASAARAWGW